jgi:hypothetical protein
MPIHCSPKARGTFPFTEKPSFVMGAGNYGGRWQWVLAGVFLFNYVLTYRGVTKGIERFCHIACR